MVAQHVVNANLQLPVDQGLFNVAEFESELANALGVPASSVIVTLDEELTPGAGVRFLDVVIIDLTAVQETDVIAFLNNAPFNLPSFEDVEPRIDFGPDAVAPVAKPGGIVTLQAQACTSVEAAGFPVATFEAAYDSAFGPPSVTTSVIGTPVTSDLDCDDETLVTFQVDVPAADLEEALNQLPKSIGVDGIPVPSSLTLANPFGVIDYVGFASFV